MNKDTNIIADLLYELSKAGQWAKVLLAFEQEPKVAGKCSRYCRASSGWTFLHQAAHGGHEAGARALIRLGKRS